MRLFRCFLFVLLLFSSKLIIASTVDVDYINYVYHPFCDYYSENFLGADAAGRGYSGVADMGGIESTLLNPASLRIKNKIQFYYEFGFKNSIGFLNGYYNNLEFSQYRKGTAYGLAYSINENYQIGLFFGRKHSINAELGTVIIYDYNYAPVDTFHSYIKKICSTINIPLSYQVNDNFQLGASLNIEMYNSEQPVVLFDNYGNHQIVKSKANFVLIRPAIGFILSFNENISLGTSFLNPEKKNIIEDATLVHIKYSENIFPWEIRSGLKYRMQKVPLNLYIDFKHIHTSEYHDMNDRNDFFIGADYKLKKYLLKLGYFSQNEYRDLSLKISDEIDYWVDNEPHDRHFLTLGGSYAWKQLNFSLSYIDSKILSPNEDSQRYFKFSITFKPLKIFRQRKK